MDNQQIKGSQMKYVIALFLVGSSLLIGTTARAGQDSWISIIFGAVFTLPLIFIYNSILRLYPGQNLYEIMIHIFGNILGKIITIIYVFYAIHLGSLIITIFSEFIHIVAMPETPKIVISSFLILVCIFMVYNGISTLGRISKFLFPLLVVSVFITIFTSFNIMDFNNIKPILNTDLKLLLDSSFTVFTNPFGEMIILTTVFSCVEPKENYKKIFLNGLIIGLFIMIFANLRNLLILGTVTEKLFPFPSYEAVSIIAIGEFFTRIEVLIGANLLLAGFIKVMVCCFSSCEGLAKVLNVKEYKYLAAPTALLMITLSSFEFKNTLEMFNFIDYYKIYVIPYQIILPIIILITGKIKIKIDKNKSENYESPFTEEI